MQRRPLKNNLAALRLARKLRQRDLARRIGIQQSEVSRIERGEREPAVRLAKRIAKALGVAVEDLF